MLEEVREGVGPGDHAGVQRVLGVMTRMVVLYGLTPCTHFCFLFCTTVPYIPPGPEDGWLFCKRQCCVNTEESVVNQLRRDLWGGEHDLELEEIKDMVKQARTGALLQPDGKACYVRFATKAADVSNNFLYGAKSNTDAVGQTNKSRFDGMEDSV